MTPASGPRKRVPYFERPPHPRDWRFWVGGVGRVLIALGLLMFLFIAYVLWGTGIQTARSQHRLRSRFRQVLVDARPAPTTTTTAPITSVPATTAPVATSTTTTAGKLPVRPVQHGDPIAELRIPRIHVDVIVVQGIGVADLKKGPGHFVETPMPGQLGNSAIAGHRTTFGAPFYDLDSLQPGDTIEVTTVAGHFVYQVTDTLVVQPSDYASVIPTRDPSVATLTLATCTPVHSAAQRLIIHSVLLPAQSDPVVTVPPTTTSAPPSTVAPDTLPGETVDTRPATTTPIGAASQDSFSQGWFGDSSALLPTVAWALALAAVCVGSYFAGRAARRLWVSVLVGFLPFLVVVYFFFENMNRLLPPNL
jgi:sortase A